MHPAKSSTAIRYTEAEKDFLELIEHIEAWGKRNRESKLADVAVILLAFARKPRKAGRAT